MSYSRRTFVLSFAWSAHDPRRVFAADSSDTTRARETRNSWTNFWESRPRDFSRRQSPRRPPRASPQPPPPWASRQSRAWNPRGFRLGAPATLLAFLLSLLVALAVRPVRRLVVVPVDGRRVLLLVLLLIPPCAGGIRVVILASVEDETFAEIAFPLFPQTFQRGGHACDAVPRVLVLRLAHHDLDGLEDVDDVVDATTLHAEFSRRLVQRYELLLAGAVQMQEVFAEQTEALILAVVRGGGDVAAALVGGGPRELDRSRESEPRGGTEPDAARWSISTPGES